MRHVAVLLTLVLSLAGGAPALAQPSASDGVLFAFSFPTALRAGLLVFADSIVSTDPLEASRALAYRGLSFARDGEPDSAVAMYERAFALDPRREPRIDLAEALLSRLAPGDAERAKTVLRPIQPVTPERPDIPYAANDQALFAWAHYLAGSADSAARLLAPIEGWLSPRHDWRYRLACVAFERGDWTRVIILLTTLAVESRDYDSDVMEMLRKSAEKLNAGRQLEPHLQTEIGTRDKIDAALLGDLGARRVALTGRDGAPLGGILLAPRAKARPRAAVVLIAPGDTLAAYDSLAVGLRRMGLAVMLVEPRGSGRSVSATCPLPDSWRGREASMQSRSAWDVRAAVSALAREAHADTAHYLVVGVGATASIAVEAARLDRRAAVMMLVSPAPSPVDRGAVRATLAALRRPVYFQTAPEDFTTYEVVDSLYRVCDERVSRVADTNKPGTFATLFRRDPKILERFKLWLGESWPKVSAPRATPPSRPRKG
jgi:tetratricopeptide (TPR) repeat protein